MGDQEPLDLVAYRADIDRAHTEVGDIARAGYRRWRMSIPAQPDRDSDLIISTGLRRGERLADEVERLNERVEYLNGRVADLQQYEVGIKHLTTEDSSINMSLALAHDQMRIFVAAFQKVLDEQGGPNYVEMDFKLAGTLDRYTVTIKRPKGKTPADVASEQRIRAERVEAEGDALNACIRATCSAARIAREVGDHRKVVLLSDVERLLTVPELPPLSPLDGGQ